MSGETNPGHPRGWPVAEEFRRLSGELQVGSPLIKSVLVTAAVGGEGTTTIAMHLAAALAEDRSLRVLLVDANLRSPAVHQRLGLELAPGLGVWDGTGAAPWQVTDVPGLQVLTAGVRSEDGIFGDGLVPTLGLLAKQVKDQFDFIVWDSPPVVRYPDAPLISTLVDGVLVVVEADRTSADTLTVASEQLARVGAKILGGVMNRRGRFFPRALRGHR
jgi:Mrp family chromosome partitioning ATPase